MNKKVFHFYLLLMPWVLAILYMFYSFIKNCFQMMVFENYTLYLTIFSIINIVFLLLSGMLVAGFLFFPADFFKEKISICICAVYTIFGSFSFVVAPFLFRYMGDFVITFYRVLYCAPFIAGVYLVMLLLGTKLRKKESNLKIDSK